MQLIVPRMPVVHVGSLCHPDSAKRSQYQHRLDNMNMAKKAAPKKKTAAAPATGGSADEQIGFHKGALTTLAKEREEMMRILQIVEQLMQMHIKSLQDLGVDLTKQNATGGAAPKAAAGKKDASGKPIEDMLR